MKFEIKREQQIVNSDYLKREVVIDFYTPPLAENLYNCQLLLVNDGQDLIMMDFKNILETLYAQNKMAPLFCAGIYCGADRKNEYGTACMPNVKGEGAKAHLYSRFVMEELLDFTRKKFAIHSFSEKSFCGFSLGGLSALDIVWNHAPEFSKVGVFSGSLWWRSLEQDDPQFDENKHRIIHNEIREGGYYSWLQFFFETGISDETADRNHNGIIDSIDDTLALIAELKKKGYPEKNIRYLELADGSHNIATWARAFPEFLQWGWGMKQ